MIRVILIEDNANDAELLIRELNHLGCSTLYFPEADAAIKHIADNCSAWKLGVESGPDIVLIDFKLTAGLRQGIDVMRAVKMHCPLVPVAIVTGCPDMESIRQALALGYFGLVEKPATAALLKEVFLAHRIFNGN